MVVSFIRFYCSHFFLLKFLSAQRANICFNQKYLLEKDKYHVISLICEILKKKDTNELMYKTETGSDFENKLTVIKGERPGCGAVG